jgi:hypothetical protein
VSKKEDEMFGFFTRLGVFYRVVYYVKKSSIDTFNDMKCIILLFFRVSMVICLTVV